MGLSNLFSIPRTRLLRFILYVGSYLVLFIIISITLANISIKWDFSNLKLKFGLESKKLNHSIENSKEILSFSIQIIKGILSVIYNNIISSNKRKVCNVFTSLQNDTEIPEQGSLSTSKGLIPIYVFGHGDLVSGHILRSHNWEGDKSNHINHLFSHDKDLHLIDLGSSLGVFTLNAAAYGRQVVAVDANYENVKRLFRSVVANNFSHLVTIVHNSIYDSRGMQTRVAVHDGNVGGAAVITENMKEKYFGKNQRFSLAGGSYDRPFGDLDDTPNSTENANAYRHGGPIGYHMSVPVKSILFDDLLQVIKFKKCVLKMDIEGSEYKALRSASRLFATIYVKLVIMEWFRLHPRYHDEVREFFVKRNYTPYSDIGLSNKLPINFGASEVFWHREA